MPVDDESQRGREPVREELSKEDKVAIDAESPQDQRTKENKVRRHVQWGPNTKRSISRGNELDEKGQDVRTIL